MNDSVRIKEPKSGRSRTVALPASVRDELRAHKLKQAQALLKIGVRVTNDSFVASLEDGSMLRPVLLTHEWRHAIRGTALPRIRFHDLRHAHAPHAEERRASQGCQRAAWAFPGRDYAGPVFACPAWNAGGCGGESGRSIQGSQETGLRTNPSWFATILLPNCLKTDKTR
jgi:hypothetical protein